MEYFGVRSRGVVYVEKVNKKPDWDSTQIGRFILDLETNQYWIGAASDTLGINGWYRPVLYPVTVNSTHIKWDSTADLSDSTAISSKTIPATNPKDASVTDIQFIIDDIYDDIGNLRTGDLLNDDIIIARHVGFNSGDIPINNDLHYFDGVEANVDSVLNHLSQQHANDIFLLETGTFGTVITEFVGTTIQTGLENIELYLYTLDATNVTAIHPDTASSEELQVVINDLYAKLTNLNFTDFLDTPNTYGTSGSFLKTKSPDGVVFSNILSEDIKCFYPSTIETDVQTALFLIKGKFDDLQSYYATHTHTSETITYSTTVSIGLGSNLTNVKEALDYLFDNIYTTADPIVAVNVSSVNIGTTKNVQSSLEYIESEINRTIDLIPTNFDCNDILYESPFGTAKLCCALDYLFDNCLTIPEHDHDDEFYRKEYIDLIWENLCNPIPTGGTGGTGSIGVSGKEGPVGPDCRPEIVDIVISKPEVDNNKTCMGHTVNFSSNSIGNIDTYKWEMGDGTIKTGQNVSHIYVDPGVYIPVLTVSNSETGVSHSRGIYHMHVLTTSMSVAFDWEFITDYQDHAPSTVYFRNNSNSVPTTVTWDFGDGIIYTDTSGTYTNVRHHYENPGTYTVRLSVVTNCDSNVLEKQIVIKEKVNIKADFTMSPNIHCIASPITDDVVVTLTSNCIGTTLDHVEWMYNGSVISTQNSTTLTFSRPGIYPISIKAVSNHPDYPDDIVTKNFEYRTYPTSEFTFIQSHTTVDNVVHFSASAHDPDYSYSFNMGDGTIYNSFAITHFYANPGTYNVTLQLTDNKCGIVTQTVHPVTVPSTITDIIITVGTPTQKVCMGDSVNFTISSSYHNCRYEWIFDGQTFTEETTNASSTATFVANSEGTKYAYVTVTALDGINVSKYVGLRPVTVRGGTLNVNFHVTAGITYDCSTTISGNTSSWEYSLTHEWEVTGPGAYHHTSNSKNLYASVTQCGTYDVKLTLTDPICGSSGTKTRSVSVYESLPPASPPITTIIGAAPISDPDPPPVVIPSPPPREEIG